MGYVHEGGGGCVAALRLTHPLDQADQPSEYDSQNPDGRLTRAWRRLRKLPVFACQQQLATR